MGQKQSTAASTPEEESSMIIHRSSTSVGNGSILPDPRKFCRGVSSASTPKNSFSFMDTSTFNGTIRDQGRRRSSSTSGYFGEEESGMDITLSDGQDQDATICGKSVDAVAPVQLPLKQQEEEEVVIAVAIAAPPPAPVEQAKEMEVENDDDDDEMWFDAEGSDLESDSWKIALASKKTEIIPFPPGVNHSNGPEKAMMTISNGVLHPTSTRNQGGKGLPSGVDNDKGNHPEKVFRRTSKTPGPVAGGLRMTMTRIRGRGTSAAVTIKRRRPSSRFETSLNRSTLDLNTSRRLSLFRGPTRGGCGAKSGAGACVSNANGKSLAKKKAPEVNTGCEYLEAPIDSVVDMPSWCDFPVQGVRDHLKVTHYDNHDDFCPICLDGGITVCCDFCPKIFHRKCHIPTLPTKNSNGKWRCNVCKSKAMLDEELRGMPKKQGSENHSLTKKNQRHFAVACKFMMEVYKIKEIPTMKWVFPKAYLDEFKKAPYHLEFLREKLCYPKVETGLLPFSGVEEYMLAFKQMFSQAFMIYKVGTKYRSPAVHCLKAFRELVGEYYPEYQKMFKGLNVNKRKNVVV